MGLFTRRAPSRAREFRVVTASGKSIDPNSPLEVRQITDGRDPSEDDCWRWYRSIGEVKFGARFMRNACSRVSLRVAVIPDPDTDPIVLTTAGERGLIQGVDPEEGDPEFEPVIDADLAEAAAEILSRMLDGQEREGALLGSWGAKSFVIGDAYLVGWVVREPIPTPRTEGDPSAPGELDLEEADTLDREVWTVLPPHSLIRNDSPGDGESRLAIKGYAGQKTPTPIPGDAKVFRIWRPNEEWPDMADSLVRGVLLECEELYALGRSIKAVALSRLSAPIIVVANELSAGGEGTDQDSENPDDDPVTAAYHEHVTTPVNDTASVSSVAGLMLRGPLDVLGNGQASLKDAIFTVDATRSIDDQTVERCSYLIARIRAGLEFPNEVYSGAGGVNHWGMWEITDSTYREFVQPTVREFADQVSAKVLRPRLLASGYDPEQVARITIIDDATGLIARPNRGSNVKDAHTAGVIGDGPAREAWGFDDGDAPTDEEIERRMILARGPLTPDMVAAWINQTTAAPPLPMPAPAALPAGPTSNGDSTGGGGDTIPDETSPDAIAAGGRRRPAGERLAAIDARLLQRLTDAADVAVARMVDRAGHRIVSTLAGVRNPDAAQTQARDLVRNVPRSRVAAILGRERLAALAIDAEQILADNLDDLQDKWTRWVRDAQREARRISRVNLDDFGEEEEAALEAKQDEHRGVAWLALAASVLTVARQSTFNPEASTSSRVPPGVIREALAKAGGSSPTTTATGGVRDVVTGGAVGLVATGDDVGSLWGAHGKPWTELQWVHDDPLSPFPWHEDLDGVTFSSHDDEVLSTAGTDAEWVGEFFHMGDHPGCLCVYAPVTD